MSDIFRGLRHLQPQHTAKVLRALLSNHAALDASQTGVGKTFCALAAARALDTVPLVLGPKGVRSGWEDASALMGVPIQFINYEKARQDRERYVCGVCGSVRQVKPMEAREGPLLCRKCEGEMSPTGEDLGRLGFEKKHGSGSYWVWNGSYEMMIFDEGHLCGGSTSVQGKMLRSSRKAANYVLGLSATIADHPIQMKNFGQVLGLFDGKGYNNWLFAHGFFPNYMGRMEWTEDQTERDKAIAKIHGAIFGKGRGARLCRRDIPGFPQTQIDTLLLEPEGSLKEIDAILAEGDGLEQRMKAARLLELEIVDRLDSPIQTALSRDNKVAVFLNFTDSLDRLVAWAQKKKLSYGIIDGRQVGERGDADRAAVIRAFQANSLDLVAVNNMAGGAGLSLHDPTGQVERTSLIVPSGNGRQMKQVVGRVQRDGGAFSTQFFVGLRRTFQEDTLRRNQSKIRNIDNLNGDEIDSLTF